MTVVTAANPTIPVVGITYPSVIGSCNGLKMDLSSSVGNGGRSWLAPTFTVQAQPSSVDVSGLVHYFNNSFPMGSPALIQSNLFAPGTSYNIKVTLCNFLNACGVGSAYFKVDTAGSIPVVGLVGSMSRTIHRMDSFSISSKSYNPSCDGSKSSANLSYTWSIQQSGLSAVNGITNEALSPSIFKLSGFKLQSGVWYSVSLTVLNVYTGVSASASVTVSVQVGSLVALIAGGAQQSIRLGDVLIIVGSKSYDEDVSGETGASLGVNYVFSCISFYPVYSNNCPFSLVNSNADPSVGVLSSNSNTTLNSNVQITLTISDNSRQSSASINVITVGAQSPVVTVNGINTVINSIVSTKFTGSVISPLACSAMWSIDDPTISLPNVSLTPYALSISANMLTPVVLVLSGGALSYSSTYRIGLTCGSVFAGIDIITNGSPQYGVFTVSPTNGTELVDEFNMYTSNWYDVNTPITYQFEFVSLNLLDMPVITRSEQTYASTLLSAGSASNGYAVVCQVRAFDNLGAYTVITQSVTVHPTSSSNAYNVLNSLSTNSDLDSLKQYIALGSAVTSRSSGSGVNCATLNRLSSSTSNDCGDCATGYVGDLGPSISTCYVLGASVVDKTCDFGCSAVHGVCTSVNVNTQSVVDSCKSNDVTCTVTCVCATGYVGYDCSTLSSSTDQTSSIQVSVLTSLNDLTSQEDASASSVASWANSITTVSQRYEYVTILIISNHEDIMFIVLH